MISEQKCVKIVLVFTFVYHIMFRSSLCFDQNSGLDKDNPGSNSADVTPGFDSNVYNNLELSSIPEVPDPNIPRESDKSGFDTHVQYDPKFPNEPEYNMPPSEFDSPPDFPDSNLNQFLVPDTPRSAFGEQEYPAVPRPGLHPPRFGSHVHPHYHRPWHDMHDRGPTPFDRPPLKMRYPGPPRRLSIYALPLFGSDHKLQFKVSWEPPLGIKPLDYSLEVISDTATEDCRMSICLEYNIPKDAVSLLIPKVIDHISGNCAFNPGCSYIVRLTANPWDGHTVAEARIDLQECTAGVCSCAHSSRLPIPLVTANTVLIEGDKYANISWSLPAPQYPQRLPKGLAKKSYVVSLGKQMVTDAHPAPWFNNIIETVVAANDAVAEGDTEKWRLLPLDQSDEESSGERSGEVIKRQILDVKLLARVNLIDERGCMGPAGNATAYDPDEVTNSSLVIYALWALGGGLCVCIMMLVLIASVRAMKKALIALRPAPGDVLEPLRHQSTWLPLQLRS